MYFFLDQLYLLKKISIAIKSSKFSNLFPVTIMGRKYRARKNIARRAACWERTHKLQEMSSQAFQWEATTKTNETGGNETNRIHAVHQYLKNQFKNEIQNCKIMLKLIVIPSDTCRLEFYIKEEKTYLQLTKTKMLT